MPSYPPEPAFGIGEKVVRIFKEPYVLDDNYEIGTIEAIYLDANGNYFYQIHEYQPIDIKENYLRNYNDFFGILL